MTARAPFGSPCSSYDGATSGNRPDDIRAAVNDALSRIVPPEVEPLQLSAAMRHGLLGPAKRVRSILLVLTSDLFDGPWDTAVKTAAAVEMVHAASLVLDDLPAMDNATLRRGKPTTHRAYGDATAILAAISLMNAGYQVLAQLTDVSAERRADAVALLSEAIGPNGLCGGQFRDLRPDRSAGLADLEQVHHGKTGALFAAALGLGATISSPAAAAGRDFWTIGMAIGLAFQGYDDLLDAFGTASQTGKDVHADAGKPTIATVLGRAEGEAWARRHLEQGLQLLDDRGHGQSALADYIRSLASTLVRPLAVAKGDA
ncbi:MAG: polyprenyl synthetase family protein [Pseudomonadota bacterium]